MKWVYNFRLRVLDGNTGHCRGGAYPARIAVTDVPEVAEGRAPLPASVERIIRWPRQTRTQPLETSGFMPIMG